MITWGDLIIKLFNAIFDSKNKLTALRRDKRDRIADYFESIARTLAEAATAFEDDSRPWDAYRGIQYHLDGFFEVTQGAFQDDAKVLFLQAELRRAFQSDSRLLNDLPSQWIVDAITVRPQGREYDSNWDENPVKRLSTDEIKSVIAREVSQLREVSGLFQAVAVELRVSG